MTELVLDTAFPTLIDNTMWASWKKCRQHMFRAHIQHLAPREPSIHLHAGGAFAFGLEQGFRARSEQGLPEDECRRLALQAIIQFYGPIVAPKTKTGDKSLDNVVRAFDSYMEQYGGFHGDPVQPYVTPDGKAMVEFNFSLPLEVAHPVTGDPLLFGGRADRIGINAGVLWVADEKTASQLGEQWSNNWILDSQFTGYIAAARQHKLPVAGALVRGVGLLKTKITHQEAWVVRDDWQIERWWEMLNADVQDMVRAWEHQELQKMSSRVAFRFALSKDACNSFGGCEFLTLCTSRNPEQWLPIEFRKRTWNPMAKDFGEALLEQPAAQQTMVAPELDIPGLLAMQGERK